MTAETNKDHMSPLDTLHIFPPLEDQLRLITPETLDTGTPLPFNPHLIAAKTEERIGDIFVSLELGGTHATRKQWVATKNNGLQEVRSYTLSSHHGKGYLKELEAAIALADKAGTPLGLSLAGKVDEKGFVKPPPNMRAFYEELLRECGGDFTALYKKTVVMNDAVTMGAAACAEILPQYPDYESLLTLIVGSGFGGSLLRKNAEGQFELVPLEPGHVEAATGVNLHGQQEQCHLHNYVCLENIVAGTRFGALYGNSSLSGEEVSGRMLSGDQKARDILANSAHLIATTTLGIAEALELPTEKGLLVVANGGVWEAAGYQKRVEKELQSKQFGRMKARVVKSTKRVNGIYGAAVGALLAA